MEEEEKKWQEIFFKGNQVKAKSSTRTTPNKVLHTLQCYSGDKWICDGTVPGENLEPDKGGFTGVTNQILVLLVYMICKAI